VAERPAQRPVGWGGAGEKACQENKTRGRANIVGLPLSVLALLVGAGYPKEYMAQRRYQLQLSMLEGGMLTLSFLVASFLIFIFGMYVGKEIQAQKTVHIAQPLRVPVVSSKTGLLARESAAISSVRHTPASLSPTAPARPAAPTVRPAFREKTRPTLSTRITAPDPIPAPHPRPLPKKAAKKPPVKALRVNLKSPKPAPVRAVTSSAPTRSVSSSPPPAPKPAEKSVTKSKGWSVQIQATTQQAAAEQTAKRLRSKGYTPSISKIVRQGKVLYRVRVGPFGRESDAKAAVSRFRREATFAQAYPVSN